MADEKSDNEQSIIALLNYGSFDMLFMGDAGINAFDDIKAEIEPNVEVLKIGHHGGSRVVNTDMLNRLNSEVSVISTGPNSFGHPVRSTLDILRNTDIYRTDRHNSIKIESDGSNYSTYLYNPEKHKYILAKQYHAR